MGTPPEGFPWGVPLGKPPEDPLEGILQGDPLVNPPGAQLGKRGHWANPARLVQPGQVVGDRPAYQTLPDHTGPYQT
jgi:hypothetical protein